MHSLLLLLLLLVLLQTTWMPVEVMDFVCMQFCCLFCRLPWHHQQPELQPLLPVQCHASCVAGHRFDVSLFPFAFTNVFLLLPTA